MKDGLRSLMRRPGNVDVHVATRIKDRRVALGMSQGRLSRLLGLSLEQIRKYEIGANRICVGRLFAISKALAVPVQYFYSDLNEDVAPEPSIADVVDQASELSKKELVELGRAFSRITCPKQRRAIVALIKAFETLPSTEAAALLQASQSSTSA